MNEPRKLHTEGAHGGAHSAAAGSGTGRKINRGNAAGQAPRQANPDWDAEPRRAAQPRSTDSRAYNGAPRTGTSSGARRRSSGSARPQSARPQTGSRRKKKKKGMGCFQIFMVTALVIFGIGFVTLRIVLNAIAPGAGSVSISQLIHTPSEYKKDEINLLICGIDWEEGRNYGNDAESNDGMTDMILYLHFDVVNKKMYMLQIPRDTFVGTSVNTGGTGKINAVALCNDGISSLAQLLYDQYGLPVDNYVTIDMQSLKEVVDTFGGLEVYVPHDIDYNGSTLKQGYQTLDGNAAEFFVRCRKGTGYANSDLDRLNMQRYFYSALFRRLRTLSIWDAAKLTPAGMNYITTDMDSGTLASLALSVMRTPSSNIMLAQMPVYIGSEYYNNLSVVVASAPEAADLLNSYFRTNQLSADQLNIQTWGTPGTASDPNIQFMGQLDTAAENGQANENLDGSYTVTTETMISATEASSEPPSSAAAGEAG